MPIAKTLKALVSAPLNRSQKLRSLMRFSSWQIGSRLIPGSVLFTWVDDAKLVVSNGERGLTGNVYEGLHEFQDMAFVLHFLTESDLFVDVGANVGSYTILACAVAKSRGVCFEPVPDTFQRLKVNLAVNELQGRVETFNRGVGDTPGELRFSTDEGCLNHILTDEENALNSIAVQVLPLDEALTEPPTMMKIDVEGFETMVLRGARETLSRPELVALLIELNGSGARYGFDENAILESLEGVGFHPYEYDPWLRKLTPLATKCQSSGNTLFLRNLDFAAERVKSSPSFCVHGFHI